ncbi:hypothetical protein Ancab_033617, partial [Ancistrocladus abbreviatus]
GKEDSSFVDSISGAHNYMEKFCRKRDGDQQEHLLIRWNNKRISRTERWNLVKLRGLSSENNSQQGNNQEVKVEWHEKVAFTEELQ